MDHYATLGIPESASADDIRRAWREAAFRHHPDRGGSAERFKEATAAYDVLGDAAKRAAYDLSRVVPKPEPRRSAPQPAPVRDTAAEARARAASFRARQQADAEARARNAAYAAAYRERERIEAERLAAMFQYRGQRPMGATDYFYAVVCPLV